MKEISLLTLNEFFVYKLTDYEDIRITPENVSWGDGYNWYSFSVEDPTVTMQILKKYRMGVEYCDTLGVWISGIEDAICTASDPSIAIARAAYHYLNSKEE